MHPVDTLVTIVDGTDLELPLAVQPEIQARHRLVVTLGVPGGLLQPVFADSQIIDMGGVTAVRAFKRICSLLDGGTHVNSTDAHSPLVLELQSAFISHAVKDEPLVAPVIDYLRNYFSANLFVCVDSISPGVNWHDTILAALQAKQVFVFLLL